MKKNVAFFTNEMKRYEEMTVDFIDAIMKYKSASENCELRNHDVKYASTKNINI